MSTLSIPYASDGAVSPILRIETHLPPSPTSVPVPPKRLRSCLSPSRRRPSPAYGVALSITSSMSTDEPSLTCSSSPMTSRSASFSSQDEGGEYWRRGRSVRWDESGGGVMAAYYSTWSADDYDRSPLEPPKPEERACFMPARGSRCLSPLDCFADVNPDDAFFPRKDFQPLVVEPIGVPSTTTLSALVSVEPEAEPEADEDDTEDREWEECMERRRMMFAQMCRPSSGSDEIETSSEAEQRRFEGYTSISASLVALLAQSGIRGQAEQRDVSTPVGTPVEVEEAVGAFGIGLRPKLVRVEHRLRVSSFTPGDEVVQEEMEEGSEDRDEVEDDAEEEDEEEHGEQPSAEMVFAALRAMRGPGRDLRTGAEERDRDSQ